MFSIHFVYIYLLFLNIYFNDSVRFQEYVRILFTLNKVTSWTSFSFWLLKKVDLKLKWQQDIFQIKFFVYLHTKVTFPVKYQSSYVFEISLILFLFTTLKMSAAETNGGNWWNHG